MNTPFLEWLIGEAGAAWILLAITSTSFAVNAIIRRTRRQHIVCQETGVTSFLAITPEVRERMEIKFDGVIVDALAQLEIRVQNTGILPIRQAELIFRFGQATRILGVAAQPIPEHLVVELDLPRENELLVRIPYLNPWRDHKHKLDIAIGVDGSPTCQAVIGGGEGWSVKWAPLPNRERFRRAQIWTLILNLLATIGLVPILAVFQVLDSEHGLLSGFLSVPFPFNILLYVLLLVCFVTMIRFFHLTRTEMKLISFGEPSLFSMQKPPANDQ